MRKLVSALALLSLIGVGPACGQSANGFNIQPKPTQPFYPTDPQGNYTPLSGGAGGASTVAGSMEQDVRTTGPLNAATANAAITTGINGQATVGYTFTGLTASGATLTYEQSIDGGTTWTGINAVNRGTGVPEATRTTDGQIALSATGRTTIRVRVSTPGTGTITVATNVSVREGIFSLGSPLPPGGNAIGSIANTAFGITGPLPAGSNTIGAVTQASGPWTVSGTVTANLGTLNGAATAANQVTPQTAGTAATGTGLRAMGNDGAAVRDILVTSTGALEPPTAADSSKIVTTSTALTANTSTTIAAQRATRIALGIQCGSGGVSISETGAALTGAAVGSGSLFIPASTAPYFTPPIASRTAITAYTATAQTCVVTEYLR